CSYWLLAIGYRLSGEGSYPIAKSRYPIAGTDNNQARSVVAGGSNRYPQTPAAAAAPISGPIQYTVCAGQSIAASAGPNASAGFMTAPVNAPPPPNAHTSTTRPIAKPPTRCACGDTHVP